MRDCANCTHRYLGSDEHPCCSCDISIYGNWEDAGLKINIADDFGEKEWKPEIITGTITITKIERFSIIKRLIICLKITKLMWIKWSLEHSLSNQPSDLRSLRKFPDQKDWIRGKEKELKEVNKALKELI